MCEYLFGQCASEHGMYEFEYSDVRVETFEYSDVRVETCKWSGYNVRVIGYLRVEMCECSGHNVRVNMKCASTVMRE